MKRRNVRTLSLIIVTFTYLLIGAAVFDHLEGDNNEHVLEGITDIKFKLIDRYNISNDDYKLIELLMIEKKPHKSGPQWKFAGSFYYALVVLALIGYGHSTPATTLGKAFTMGYAMAGIPMAMIMFQSMGERMNKFYSVIIRRIRIWLRLPRIEATEFDLIVASGITSNIVVLSGAIMYHTQEGWSFFDSLYYTFITLSTIGFGDFVALQSGSQALQFRPGYVVCSFIFLLLGLAALSSSINLLVLRFMILSLEEDEADDDQSEVGGFAAGMTGMMGGGNNKDVTTLDGELLAVNGRVLAGQSFVATSERNICAASAAAAAASKDTASVCSCTCYGGRGRGGRSSTASLAARTATAASAANGGQGGNRGSAGNRLLWCVGKVFGCRESITDLGGENYYDSETQSISNYTRFAVKRASF